MRVRGLGHVLFALGLAGIGLLSLFSGHFAYSWQPVPMGLPWRVALAHIFGLGLFVFCLGMLFKRTADISAFVVTIYLACWVIFLHGPQVLHAPANVGAWLGVAENMVLVCGGWILFGTLAGTTMRERMPFLVSQRGMRIARILVGLACLVLGLSHFVYTAATASMVPAWLPFHTGFAYLTGAGHIAAGLGILLSIFPRLAATAEACMISIFVLILHLPSAVAQPTSRLQWTMFFIATALAGGFWIVAKSLEDRPWGWTRKS